jgi:hypothetical protein
MIGTSIRCVGQGFVANFLLKQNVSDTVDDAHDTGK